MQKITPFLWFEKNSKEVEEFYLSIFEGKKIGNTVTFHNTPSGQTDTVELELLGFRIGFITAGPFFKFTPAISFMVMCTTEEEVQKYWDKLSPGGKVLMEMGSYPFSKKYGWLNDKYGLSWQIMHAGDTTVTQKIIPSLMFTQAVYGKAEEAINFYGSVFKDFKIDHMMRFGKNDVGAKEDFVMHAGFTLEGVQFAAIDAPGDHKFTFNEAVSLSVHCDSQEEIDYYFEKLSADPSSEQCGWLKDKYGVSWQITSIEMEKMFREGSEDQIERVVKAFMPMKKFDLEALRKAYTGN